MRSAQSRSGEAHSALPAWSADTVPSGTPRAFDFLFASGELLPTQLASRSSHWGAEKKLAAAVLESALAEIRDHCGARGHLRSVKDALEWVRSDDMEWPYSFRPLCELFGLDPTWVRERVTTWTLHPRATEGSKVRYRHAA